MLYAEYRKGNKEGMHNNCVEWVKRNKDNLISSLVIICGILVALLPLRKAFLPGGYYPDLGYHLLRIEGVKDAITAGDFPARIYHLALNGWGYGGSMFYQDYLLFIPALCRLVGFDVITSYKVLIVIATVLISVSTYFSVKYITNSNYSSSLATIALLLSQYYLADVYNRSGVSEYLAFIFVPVLVAGIYDTLAKQCEKPWLIGVALFGLLLTHSITFALGVVLLLGCFLIRAPYFWKNPQYIVKLFKVAVITILSTAFIYVPILEQMGSGLFRFHNPWAHVEDMVQPISTWFRSTGYFNTIAYVGIGIPLLICLCLRLILWKNRNKKADIFILCGILLVLITSNAFLWRLIGKTPLDFIQFPYRLYSFAIPVLTIGCCIFWENIFSNNRIASKCAYIFLGAVIAYSGLMQVDNLDYAEETENMTGNYFDEPENTFYLGAEEWLPANIKGKHLLGKERMVLANVNETSQRPIAFYEDKGALFFDTIEQGTTYQIPLIYYKGYGAEVTKENGSISSVAVYTDDSNQGNMYVSIPEGVTGHVKIFYAGTMAQKISTWISGVTILFLLLHRFLLRKRHPLRES